MKFVTSLLLLLFASFFSYGQWTNLNTGINDDLTGAVFLGQNGMACGAGGIYYTTNGGSGPASWTRFQITDNTANSDIYENTNFTHCVTWGNNDIAGVVYACGQNTATSKAVIFKITIPSMAYEIIYQGAPDTKLNKIDGSYFSMFLAVGDDGLLVIITNSSVTAVNTGIAEDLTSVDTFGEKAVFGSGSKLFYTTYGSTSIGTIKTIDTPGDASKDVMYTSDTDIYSLGSNSWSDSNISSTVPSVSVNQNFYGPLNSNGWLADSATYYVGTANGIYKSSATTLFANTTLELQPSSLNYHIRDFSKQNNSTSMYAFGNNGVILKTTNGGGAVKPYVKIINNGGCFPGSTNFSAIYGSANAGSWYVGSNLFHTGLSPFNYPFPNAGTYTITLVGQNSFGEQGTDTKIINMVNPPVIDKPFTVSDNMLCKQEVIQVQVDNPEPNVYYSLKVEGQPALSFGQSQPGTGTITALIDLTGDYYIYATNNTASCGRRFSGNFHITVEETTASFHCGLINAEVNEEVRYFENSIDSQAFNWQFTPSASLMSSPVANPVVTFAQPGTATSSLQSWSASGCTDIVTKSAPVVLQTPTAQEDCFLLDIKSHDPVWPGHYNPDISQMIPTQNGLFICGTYFDELFPSKFGTTHSMAGKKGGYVAKYDRSGTVKWVAHTVSAEFGDHNSHCIYSVAEDSGGNVYISGKGQGMFYDNAGKSVTFNHFASLPELTYFIIKLNPHGELLWHMEIHDIGFVRIAVDHEDNLVAISQTNSHVQWSHPVFLNGTASAPIATQSISTDATNLILKISPQGTVIWESKAWLESANRQEFRGLGFDMANNIYLGMCFDGSATVYQPGNGNISQTINGEHQYGSVTGIMKMTKDGVILWKMRSRTTNTLGIMGDETWIEQMKVEDDGTMYITGTNGTGIFTFGANAATHYFENTDGTLVSTVNGPYFAAKVNPNGICQWIRSMSAVAGSQGYAILKSGNEVVTIGRIDSSQTGTSTFDSADGNGYTLTMDKNDYFIAMYDDTTSVLKKVFVNNEGGNYAYYDGFNGFFKGDGDYYYLAKNVNQFSPGNAYTDMGMTTPTDGRDGIVLRFTPDCAVLKYTATLASHDIAQEMDNLILSPNPTNGEFHIPLPDMPDAVEMTVYDISGKLIQQQTFSNTAQIDSAVSGASGIYFIKLSTGAHQKWFKLVKS